MLGIGKGMQREAAAHLYFYLPLTRQSGMGEEMVGGGGGTHTGVEKA